MTIEGLISRRALGVRLELEVITRVHDALGRPSAGRPTVHVVGTNGKGSTAMLLEHGLRRRGLRTGLYTSPHLHRLVERIRIDGQPVADPSLDAALDRVRAVEAQASVSRPLSFFELLTLAALVLFDQAEVDAIILEAGLGGARDATRIADAHVVAVTSIGLDHQALIGPTLVDITYEKAGALRPGVPAVSAPQASEVAQVLEQAAQAMGAPLQTIEPLLRTPRGLWGTHQRINAALALAAGRLLCPDLAPALAPEDLDDPSIPGRLEPIPLTSAPNAGVLWLDLAHNPAGVAVIRAAIASGDVPAPDLIVLGCHADKDRAGMEAELDPLGAPRWWIPLQPGAPATQAARTFAGIDDPTLWPAVQAAVIGGSTVLCLGSHALVGAVRALARGDHAPIEPQDPRPGVRSAPIDAGGGTS